MCSNSISCNKVTATNKNYKKKKWNETKCENWWNHFDLELNDLVLRVWNIIHPSSHRLKIHAETKRFWSSDWLWLYHLHWWEIVSVPNGLGICLLGHHNKADAAFDRCTHTHIYNINFFYHAKVHRTWLFFCREKRKKSTICEEKHDEGVYRGGNATSFNRRIEEKKIYA